MTEHELRDLTGRWVDGWCVSRGMASWPDGRGWWVDVGADSRSTELFLAGPSSAELQAAVEQVQGRPEAWLTVLGGDADLIGRSTASLADVYDDDALMRLDLAQGLGAGTAATGGVHGTDQTAELVHHEDGEVQTLTVRLAGQEAARGQAAVHGSDVVLDRVLTEPAFRRRGLGRLVVSALCAWARGRGAEVGLLAASVPGRRLYASLGWQHVATLRTFAGVRRPADRPPS